MEHETSSSFAAWLCDRISHTHLLPAGQDNKNGRERRAAALAIFSYSSSPYFITQSHSLNVVSKIASNSLAPFAAPPIPAHGTHPSSSTFSSSRIRCLRASSYACWSVRDDVSCALGSLGGCETKGAVGPVSSAWCVPDRMDTVVSNSMGMHCLLFHGKHPAIEF